MSAESLLPISEAASRISFATHFPLSWSHYVTLILIKDEQERSFHEIEAAQNNWSARELKRQLKYHYCCFQWQTILKNFKNGSNYQLNHYLIYKKG